MRARCDKPETGRKAKISACIGTARCDILKNVAAEPARPGRSSELKAKWIMNLLLEN
jgi:hypothetical protein